MMDCSPINWLVLRDIVRRIGLYGYALLVDANGAALWGWLWLTLRACYPLLFGTPLPAFFARMASADTPPPYAAVLISTLPSYACVWYLVASSAYAAVQLSSGYGLDGLD